jgi:hypothetical protein
MAPDLNTVPPSPRPVASSPLTSRTTSRRTSQQMAASLPIASQGLNILPSNQGAVNASTMGGISGGGVSAGGGSGGTGGAGGTGIIVGDNTGVGTGPGPLRHPRPLTAADLHLQLEKEQEAVVCLFPFPPTTFPSYRLPNSPSQYILKSPLHFTFPMPSPGIQTYL